MKRRFKFIIIPSHMLVCVASLLCCHPGVQAQTVGDKSDKEGEEQKLRVPKELIPPAPARSPEEELKTFTIAPGFRIELVAAEPLVEDPISIQFDPDGRMWVVEMRGYMNTLDAGGEDQPIGRIVVLSDTDGDGRMDHRTVFADGLVMPRALALVGDGAIVGEPPHLWFMRDTDGDGRADQKTEIVGGFGALAGPQFNTVANHPARGPNSPMWALDNWICFAEYAKCLRYTHGEFMVAPAPSHGQYGLTQDDAGRLFFNNNSDLLRTSLTPDHYANRNPHLASAIGADVSVAADQLVWPVRVNPGVNRGYKPEQLREDGRLKTCTAACSPVIYRGDLFPADCQGNAFICEPAGNLVRRSVLTEKDGKLIARNACEHAEFLASTDERFRPVNLASAPDGCLYVTDFYRGIIEHRLSYTTYLLNQIKERGLLLPVHRGRIWRIVPVNAKPKPAPRLSAQSPAQLVAHLSHPNGWWRDTAQRLLVEKGGAGNAPALKELAAHGKSALGRLHALWTMEGLALLDESTITDALRDTDERVRSAAVRLTEPWLQKPESAPALLGSVLKLTADTSPSVRQQLALTLGEARSAEAGPAAASLMDGAPDPALMAFCIASGLGSRELATLEHLQAGGTWERPSAARQRLLRTLASCLAYERSAANFGRLLELAGKSETAWQQSLLLGINDARTYLARRPIALSATPPALDRLLHSKSATVVSAAHGVAALITWPRRTDGPKLPSIPPLSTEEQKRFELGKLLYTGTCAACHQTHGRGLTGAVPPLLDSDWVTGPPERLVKIALHGVYGPINAAGKFFWQDMPAFGAFPDEQLAAILTYLRREWEHGAAPIDPEFVSRIRHANEGHSAWSAEELLAPVKIGAKP